MPDSAVHVLGLDIPNFLPGGLQGAGRLIWSTLVLVVAVVVIGALARRPRSPEPATWAASIAGAVLTLALMALAYGVVPHEWLTYASAKLNWGKDTYIFETNSLIPVSLPRQGLADLVAVLIYGGMLTLNVALFVMWQKRPVRTAEDGEAPERTPKGTSAFGRPVTTK